MLFFVVVFFYGVVGWVSGVIFAFVYNVLARVVGGLKLEVK